MNLRCTSFSRFLFFKSLWTDPTSFSSFHHRLASSSLNPKTHWTFSSEDFVSPGVSSTRLSAKVHFLLTREGMELASRQIDP